MNVDSVINLLPGTVTGQTTQPFNAVFDQTGNIPSLQMRSGTSLGMALAYGVTHVPVYLPSSGSMGANGAVTITTALPETFSSGVWLRFPAAAVYAGSPAGVYFAIMTSATLGTVYNVQLTGLPYLPSSLPPVVDPGPGAYTQTTAALVPLVTLTLPANAIGPNGDVEIKQDAAWINNANTKTFNMLFGAQTLMSVSHTTNQTIVQEKRIGNRGVTNAQVTSPAGQEGTGVSSSGAPLQLAQDTTQQVTITWQGNLVTAATDWMGLDAIRVVVYPA